MTRPPPRTRRPSAAVGALLAQAFVAAVASAQPATEEVEIHLRIGQEHVIDARDIASYSSSGPFDLEFRPQPPRLVARFERAGRFSVLLLFEDGHARRVTFVVG